MRKTTRNLAFGLGIAAALTTGWLVATPRAAASAAPESSKLIATVDVISLIEGRLGQADLVAARKAELDRLTTEVDRVQKELEELENQADTMDRNSPEFAQLFQTYQQKQQDLQSLLTQSRAAWDSFSAKQAAALYLEIRDAVDAVAQREGYTYVVASDSERGLGDNLAGYVAVSQQVLGRPLLHGPAGADLTELVREELGYPTPEEVLAQPGADEDLDAPDAEPGANDATETDDTGATEPDGE